MLYPPLSQPTLRLDGRVYIITGGTQGLGLSIARILKEQGASGLILVSRNSSKGQQCCNELNSELCKCIHIVADLKDCIQIEGIVPKALEQFPSGTVLSGLINAAATTARGNLMTETVSGFDDQFAINVRAPFVLTQAVVKHMINYNVDSGTGQQQQEQRERRRNCNGSIVNICSCAVYGGAPFVMAYSASKSALATMTRTHAHEVAQYGIRINAINMGWCYTDNEHTIQSSRNINWLSDADNSVPLGRILRPNDVACLVNYLLSDASIMMTASIIEFHPEYPHGMISLATTETDGR